MSGPKPLDTRYKGYLFRSRLEARWAVFYDALHLNWIYEMEGFDLGGGLTYLPDFFFPDLKIWIEIKAQRPTKVEMTKVERLAKLSGQRVYIFFGVIPYYNGVHLEQTFDSAWVYYPHGGWDGDYWWCECPTCHQLGIEFEGAEDRICREKCKGAPPFTIPISFSAAYQKARSARFEHGAQT